MAQEEATAVVDTADKVTPKAPSTPEAPPKKFDRDQIRSAILTAAAEVEKVECFGVTIEIRAPDLETLTQYRDFKTDDTVLARAIVNNVYVPDTETRVFDEADIPELMKSKFSKDMRKLVAGVNRVLGGDEQILQDVDNQTKRD